MLGLELFFVLSQIPIKIYKFGLPFSRFPCFLRSAKGVSVQTLGELYVVYAWSEQNSIAGAPASFMLDDC